MKNRILIFTILIGLIGIFAGCEKDGEIITISDNVVAPQIVTVPNLTFSRDNSSDSIEFTATPVDPGFEASANYFLEASPEGDDFEETVQIYSGTDVDNIKMTIADLNSLLLEIIPEDQESSVEFRLRCELVVDAGTGYEEREYISEAKAGNALPFGLPRLDILGMTSVQKIESPASDGIYSGYVMLYADTAITLYDPDTDTEYGGAEGSLVVDGAAIVPGNDGLHKLTADINELTYLEERYSVGIIGSVIPPYDWSEDIDMDYDFENETWSITIDMIEGTNPDDEGFKFRLNDDWGWNLGLEDGSDVNLVQDGANILVPEAGNYTITLIVTDYDNAAGTFEMVKN